MYAVVRTGGKQYRVAKDTVLKVESLAGDVGAKLDLEVLMLGGDKPQIGAPLVKGASVQCEILGHCQGEKVIAFKKRRRKHSKRKRGYRDELTLVRISEILADGKSPTKGPRPKKAAAPKAAPAEAAE